jgi:hypothetical protein
MADYVSTANQVCEYSEGQLKFLDNVCFGNYRENLFSNYNCDALIRFQLNLLKNIEINSVILTVTASERTGSDGDFNMQIRVFDTVNCPEFSLPLTPTLLNVITLPTPAFSSGSKYSFDITSLVREMIAKDDWESGNNIGIMLYHNDAGTNECRFIYTTSNVPTLTIKYSVIETSEVFVECGVEKELNHYQADGVDYYTVRKHEDIYGEGEYSTAPTTYTNYCITKEGFLVKIAKDDGFTSERVELFSVAVKSIDKEIPISEKYLKIGPISGYIIYSQEPPKISISKYSGSANTDSESNHYHSNPEGGSTGGAGGHSHSVKIDHSHSYLAYNSTVIDSELCKYLYIRESRIAKLL